ncbi:MAG: hypothetical protein HOE90_24795 [Bacteriovoracaceae bacterium]|jgi:hypothetical protein|nr:hypothetical protein [Bacteriovoracaceae bacterium]
MRKIQIIAFGLFLSSCGFIEQRTFVDEMEAGNDWMVPTQDFNVVRGDSGRAFRNTKEVLARTPMLDDEKRAYKRERFLEEELRKLEDDLPDEEYQHYLRYKGELSGVSEKIYFLKVRSIASREEYAQTRGLGHYQNNFRNTASEAAFAVRTRDLLLGMAKDQVLSSWGRPSRVDVAGNPRLQNERWSYYRKGKFKFVYFESGRVQGWDDGGRL